MDTNVNYAMVGAFVIVLTAIIIFAIIWLSSGFNTNEKFTMYQVYMKESVSGLSLDAPVEYNGVNVGTVTSIKINRRNPQLVELMLKVKSDTPVTRGTKAKLDVRALSGVAYMQLEDKGIDMTPLLPLPGQKYAVINTTPSLFVRIDTAITQLNNSFHQLSTSISSLLNDQNLQSVKKILQEGQGSLKLIKTQTIPATNQMMYKMNNLATDLSEISVQMKQNPSILIRGKAQPALGPGEQ